MDICITEFATSAVLPIPFKKLAPICVVHPVVATHQKPEFLVHDWQQLRDHAMYDQVHPWTVVLVQKIMLQNSPMTLKNHSRFQHRNRRVGRPCPAQPLPLTVPLGPEVSPNAPPISRLTAEVHFPGA